MAKRFLSSLFLTTIGRKYIIALGGLVFFLYVIVHLLGNLTLLANDPDLYNSYSHILLTLGPLLWIIELILLAAFLFHGILATIEKLKNKNARTIEYKKSRSAGSPSRKTVSSTTMIYTGLAIFIFVIIHVATFKYGLGIEERVTSIHGVAMRDLHSQVVQVFQNEWYVIGYVAVMLFLGFHLRHGFWSAFQSLGAMNPRLTPLFYGAGTVLAILLATGYIVIPIWIYFVY